MSKGGKYCGKRIGEEFQEPGWGMTENGVVEAGLTEVGGM